MPESRSVLIQIALKMIHFFKYDSYFLFFILPLVLFLELETVDGVDDFSPLVADSSFFCSCLEEVMVSFLFAEEDRCLHKGYMSTKSKVTYKKNRL